MVLNFCMYSLHIRMQLYFGPELGSAPSVRKSKLQSKSDISYG